MREDSPQRDYSSRELFNAVRYMVRAGCPWRMIPNDLPPWPTVHAQAQRWIKAGCRLQGAAGVVESIVCLKAMQDGIIPPTINLDKPGEGCDLDYVPHTAREGNPRVCINNSFGFGGHNATLVLKKFEG